MKPPLSVSGSNGIGSTREILVLRVCMPSRRVTASRSVPVICLTRLSRRPDVFDPAVPSYVQPSWALNACPL